MSLSRLPATNNWGNSAHAVWLTCDQSFCFFLASSNIAPRHIFARQVRVPFVPTMGQDWDPGSGQALGVLLGTALASVVIPAPCMLGISFLMV